MNDSQRTTMSKRSVLTLISLVLMAALLAFVASNTSQQAKTVGLRRLREFDTEHRATGETEGSGMTEEEEEPTEEEELTEEEEMAQAEEEAKEDETIVEEEGEIPVTDPDAEEPLVEDGMEYEMEEDEGMVEEEPSVEEEGMAGEEEEGLVGEEEEGLVGEEEEGLVGEEEEEEEEEAPLEEDFEAAEVELIEDLDEDPELEISGEMPTVPEEVPDEGPLYEMEEAGMVYNEDSEEEFDEEIDVEQELLDELDSQEIIEEDESDEA